VLGNVIHTEPRDAYAARMPPSARAFPRKARPIPSTGCAVPACRPSSRRHSRSCWATMIWPWAPVPK
jgi:hypothetical protein